MQQYAQENANTYRAENERSSQGHCQPSNDDEPDRDDGPGFRSRDGHIPEGQALRL
jgi:hypothetical protein